MIKSLVYENKVVSENIDIGQIINHIKNKNLVWVHFENPSNDEIEILKRDFKFHPLAIEDCLHKFQRPKVDSYKDYYFIILNVFKGRNVRKLFTYSEIYMFVGANYLITLSWDSLQTVNAVYDREIKNPKIIEKGIDFLLYSLLDAIVDDYFPLTDAIGDKIEAIEDMVLKSPKKEIQNEILILKRNMSRLRRILSPQREVLNILLRHDFELITEEARLYFMDVYDHILRINDLIDNYHDLLSSTLDLYMTQMSNKMNEIMKVLTIITTIMMPLTVITGIYGMNFEYMPELKMKNGYYLTLALMAFIAFIEVLYLKIKKWM
jgi:magnesium transporter